jgi:hypothetical protein
VPDRLKDLGAIVEFGAERIGSEEFHVFERLVKLTSVLEFEVELIVFVGKPLRS